MHLPAVRTQLCTSFRCQQPQCWSLLFCFRISLTVPVPMSVHSTYICIICPARRKCVLVAGCLLYVWWSLLTRLHCIFKFSAFFFFLGAGAHLITRHSDNSSISSGPLKSKLIRSYYYVIFICQSSPLMLDFILSFILPYHITGSILLGYLVKQNTFFRALCSFLARCWFSIFLFHFSCNDHALFWQKLRITAFSYLLFLKLFFIFNRYIFDIRKRFFLIFIFNSYSRTSLCAHPYFCNNCTF